MVLLRLQVLIYSSSELQGQVILSEGKLLDKGSCHYPKGDDKEIIIINLLITFLSFK